MGIQRDTIANELVQSQGNYFGWTNQLLDRQPKLLSAADTTLTTEHCGRTTIIPNIGGAVTITLATPALGDYYHLVYLPLAADGHTLTIETGSDNTVFFYGGVVHHDTNESGQTSAMVFGDGDSNSTMVLASGGHADLHFLGASSTQYYLWGHAAGDTPITCVDQ